MSHIFSISYMACQTCQARVNCDSCQARLEEAVMQIEGVNGASLQMAQKQLIVDTEASQDLLADCLEDLGIFIN